MRDVVKQTRQLLTLNLKYFIKARKKIRDEKTFLNDDQTLRKI